MKILLACGGTAGHIFPALALAEELTKEKESCQIIMVVSTQPRDKKYLRAAGPLLNKLHIETVATIGLPYKISFKFVLFAARILWAFVKSFFIVFKYRPQVVVGFGGYTSFAPLIVARLVGIPMLIHEQNVMPGRANRFLARMADTIAVSFDGSNGFFSRISLPKKIIRTGFPLRKQILNHAPSSFRTEKEKFTIFVLGGSQGAHNINELVLNCLSLIDRTTRQRLHLIHLAGKADLDQVKLRYKTLGIAHQVFDFIEDMTSAYKVSDLMISRSGAGAIFEAANFGLACIFIPYSCAAQHQSANASFLQQRGAALVLDEKASSSEDLKKMLLALIAEEKIRQNLGQRIKMLVVPQARGNLKEEVLALHRGDDVQQ